MSNAPPPNVMNSKAHQQLVGRYKLPTIISLNTVGFLFTYQDDEGNELILKSQDGWIVYEEHPLAVQKGTYASQT